MKTGASWTLLSAEGGALPQDWGDRGVEGGAVPISDFIRLAGMYSVYYTNNKIKEILAISQRFLSIF